MTPKKAPGITVTPVAGLQTTEKNAGAVTFDVVLNTQPTADVTIAVSSNDTTEGTDISSIRRRGKTPSFTSPVTRASKTGSMLTAISHELGHVLGGP